MTNPLDPRLCAWWAHKQGLDGSLEGATAAEVLERSGWARSVGGAAPYLTLFARAGVGRAEADAAVAAAAIHELPSARGCTHVLPAADFALGLTVGESFGEGEMKVASKLGVTDAEVKTLCETVVEVLGNDELDPEALRKKVGVAARSLGPEGIKKGITTTLPLALGALQVQGKIRRVPVNGRLDQQRYRYCVWKPNPRMKWKLNAAESFVELARRYFTWTGPASLKEFQWFSGLGAGAAKAAIAPLDLVEVGGRLLMPRDLAAFEKFKAPKHPQYALVSSLDNISLLRRDLTSLLSAEDVGRDFVSSKSKVPDLQGHAITDRGRVVGLWEFDPESGTIAWLPFVPRNGELHAAVAKMEVFVREDLGDARSFSLDSPKSRAPRIEALRTAAGR